MNTPTSTIMKLEQPWENFLELVDWQFEEANCKEQAYLEKYYPEKTFQPYTRKDLFAPSSLDTTKMALRRWYNMSHDNEDGSSRYQQQNLYYTLLRKYADLGDHQRLVLAGDNICYCDRDTVWSNFLLEEGVRVAQTHPNIFRCTLYYYLFDGWSYNGPEEITLFWPKGFEDEMKLLRLMIETTINEDGSMTFMGGRFTQTALDQTAAAEEDEDLIWESCHERCSELTQQWSEGHSILA